MHPHHQLVSAPGTPAQCVWKQALPPVMSRPDLPHLVSASWNARTVESSAATRRASRQAQQQGRRFPRPARPARRAGCGPCATALRRCRRKAMRRALPHARLPPLSLSPAVGPENPSSTREPRLARADAARGPLDPALGIVQWGKRASWKQSGSFSCPYISLVLRGPLAPDFGIGRARPGPHRRPLPCLLCPDPGNSEVRASARACARACPCARIRMCFLCVPAACVRVCERAHV